MLRSFNSLALRQLRTRPLRSAADRASASCSASGWSSACSCSPGTIRATFDEVIDSAWGKTDLIVMGEGSGTHAGRHARPRSGRSQGVRDAAGHGRRHVHAARRPTASPVEGPTGQILIAGYDTEGYQPYDFRLVKGAGSRAGREMMVEQNWASERGYRVGDRVRVAEPDRADASCRSSASSSFTSSLNVGGLGLCRDAARRRAAAVRPAAAAGCRSHRRRTTAATSPRCSKRRQARARRRRATCRRPGEFSDDDRQAARRRSTSSSTSSRASRCSSAAS